MSYQVFIELINLLNNAKYPVQNQKFDKNSGDWQIIFKSGFNNYKITWLDKTNHLEFQQKNILGFWSLIFAGIYKEKWTSMDILLYIEHNPLFNKQNHQIKLQPDYLKLPEKIRDKLSLIQPSRFGHLDYFPCKVDMKSKISLQNVYLVECNSYYKMFGVRPGAWVGSKEILVDEIEDIGESPNRIPADIATSLYKTGESGMGYVVFRVFFKDGCSKVCCSPSGSLDFILMPSGKTTKDIIKITPHVKPLYDDKEEVEFYWCLFQGIKKIEENRDEENREKIGTEPNF